MVLSTFGLKMVKVNLEQTCRLKNQRCALSRMDQYYYFGVVKNKKECINLNTNLVLMLSFDLDFSLTKSMANLNQ